MRGGGRGAGARAEARGGIGGASAAENPVEKEQEGERRDAAGHQAGQGAGEAEAGRAGGLACPARLRPNAEPEPLADLGDEPADPTTALTGPPGEESFLSGVSESSSTP